MTHLQSTITIQEALQTKQHMLHAADLLEQMAYKYKISTINFSKIGESVLII